MTAKDFFISWDFVIACLIGIGCWFSLPEVVGGTVLKELYFAFITVLAIMYPIFFAALAIMMSFSDNDFVDFLEQDGVFKDLLSQFAFSMKVLFATLIISLLVYGHVIFHLSDIAFGHLKLQVTCVVVLFFYTLVAVFLSTLDAIHYLKYRIDFIRIRHNKSK